MLVDVAEVEDVALELLELQSERLVLLLGFDKLGFVEGDELLRPVQVLNNIL